MAGAPFVPLDPRWWPDIARALMASGEPWPREAVLFDLRWWADQERRGRTDKGVAIVRPGRPTLERRWGWSGRQARNILKAEHEWADPRHFKGDQDAASERPTSDQDAASERPAFDAEGVDNIEAPFSERTGSGQSPASERPVCGPTRVLYPQSTLHGPQSTPSSPEGVSPQEGKSEQQEGGDQETEPGDTPDLARHETCEAETAHRTAPRQPDFRAKEEPNREVYADPHHLAAVWAEELDASPAALRGGRAGTGHRGQRGRSMGLMPVWPLEMLEAGPAEAEMAVRAVAELCRGTATRAPRVLEWAAFFGDRAQMPTAWREALAWKLGEAGEPTLGRQYVKPEKDGTPPRALGGPDPMSLFYTGDS